MGKTHKIAPSPWDCVTPQELGGPTHGDSQHAQKFGENRACGSGDCSRTDRQTDTHTDTQTWSLQYFANTAAGEVKINNTQTLYR